jgi:hypothetical protein
MILGQGDKGTAYPAIVKVDGVLIDVFGDLADIQGKRD